MASEACATGCPSEDVIFPERMASSCASASEKPKAARKKIKTNVRCFIIPQIFISSCYAREKTYKYKEKRILYIQNG